LAVASALVSVAGAAQAAVTLQFGPAWGSTEGAGASATGVFTFADVGDSVRMDLVLSNTTDGSLGLGATAATLVGIGFDLPTFTSVGYDDGGTSFTKFWNDPSLPPYGQVDIGVSPPRNNFQGGNPQTGLTAGQTLATISFTIDTTLTAAQFEAAFGDGHLDGGGLAAFARFQQVNAGGGSDKVLGGSPPPPNEPPPPPGVPEPGTWALMILGFGGAGAMLRAQRRRAVA
jgi:hypothetical protein